MRRIARAAVAALTLAQLAVAPRLADVALAQTAPSTPSSQASVAAGDYPVPGGWFYTEAAAGCSPIGVGSASGARGYLVVDDVSTGNFWTEFRRFGGVPVLGYPVSQPYHYPPSSTDGYWYQAFQRGILQFHPETGRAEMANVFDQFTAAGLDPVLEFMGIPLPQPVSDPDARMAMITEPRFLARYFFNPVAFHSSEPDLAGMAPITNEPQAETFFGLPEAMPQQLTVRETPGGRLLYPWAHPFLAQRFQKGGLQLFLTTSAAQAGGPVALDATVVPGDGVPGNIALTAVGLLARTIGVDKLVPSGAVQPLPIPSVEPPYFNSVVSSPDAQKMVQVEFSGCGYGPSERLTITFTPVLSTSTSGSLNAPVVQAQVPPQSGTTYANGAFDQVVSAPVGRYTIAITGATSKKTYSTVVDLSIPTVVASATPGAQS